MIKFKMPEGQCAGVVERTDTPHTLPADTYAQLTVSCSLCQIRGETFDVTREELEGQTIREIEITCAATKRIEGLSPLALGTVDQ